MGTLRRQLCHLCYVNVHVGLHILEYNISNAQRLHKLIYLHLLTGCFMKISLQSSEQNDIVLPGSEKNLPDL